MIAVIAFLRSPLGIYIMAGLAVLALLAGIYFKGKADQHASDLPQITDSDTHASWESEAIAAQRDLRTCHISNDNLSSALDRQGAAVTALKAESDARVAASVKAVSGARAVAESYRQNAASILKARPGVDRCQSASDLIAEAVK